MRQRAPVHVVVVHVQVAQHGRRDIDQRASAARRTPGAKPPPSAIRNGRCSLAPSPPCWPKPILLSLSAGSARSGNSRATPCGLIRSSAGERSPRPASRVSVGSPTSASSVAGERPRRPNSRAARNRATSRDQLAGGIGEIDASRRCRCGATTTSRDSGPSFSPAAISSPSRSIASRHRLHAVIGAGDEQDVLARRVEPPHGLEHLPDAARRRAAIAARCCGEPSGEWWPV